MSAICNHPEGKCDSMNLNYSNNCIHNCTYKINGVSIPKIKNEIQVGSPIRTYKETNSLHENTLENIINNEYDINDINDNVIICGSNLKMVPNLTINWYKR